MIAILLSLSYLHSLLPSSFLSLMKQAPMLRTTLQRTLQGKEPKEASDHQLVGTEGLIPTAHKEMNPNKNDVSDLGNRCFTNQAARWDYNPSLWDTQAGGRIKTHPQEMYKCCFKPLSFEVNLLHRNR